MRKNLENITALRFVAAFYVFIFHMNIRVPLPDSLGFVKQIVWNGAAGMSLFFVLSGFILTYTYNTGITKDYYKKRIARIFPAYLLMGLITIPFLFKYDAETNLAIISTFLTGTQAWFYNSFYLWNFGGSWSVSAELFFYLMFPLVLSKITNHNKLIFLISSWLVASIIILCAKHLSIDRSFVATVYYATPIYRLPEFIFGVTIGYYYTQGKRVNTAAFLITVAIAIFSLTKAWTSPMSMNFVILPFIGISLIYLSQNSVSANRCFGVKEVFIYLGKISYSFYLMQLPLLMFLDRYGAFFDGNVAANWIIYFCLNVLMASFSYHFVESNPFIRRVILNFPSLKGTQSAFK